MNWYCIAVIGGYEEKFCTQAQRSIGDAGRVVVFKKKMRLKNGKSYEDLLFPGYVFLESGDILKFRGFRKFDGFCRFLPDTKTVRALDGGDLQTILNLLSFGTVLDEVPVVFDKNDRIVIVDGPFKSMTGRVVAVNRRNKRVNVEIDFLNSARVIGLTYTEIAFLDD